MTNDELKTDLVFLVKQSGITADQNELDTHVDFAIRRGVNDFWCAAPWSFSTRTHELTITSNATDKHELPDDCRGIASVRHKEDTYGGPIDYYTKQRFDREFPAPLGYDVDTPIICTSYYDRDDKVSYMQFNRPPTIGMVVYLEIFTTVGDVEAVPDGYESGVMASIERFLYKLGSQERYAAQSYYIKELGRLRGIDSPFQNNFAQVIRQQQREGELSWCEQLFSH